MKRGVMLVRKASYLGVFVVFGLLGLTILSASILSKVTLSAHADDHIDVVTLTVPASCNISGYIDTENNKEHNATVSNGIYQTDIGETVITVSCNDNDGFSVYAIGYGENTDGTTTLKGTNTNLTIPTGTVTDTSVSNWAMKLTAISGTFTPTILSDTNGSYANYHVVPATATKVVTYTNSTNLSSESQFKTTYAVGISATQPADTYTGKVKYILVHPNLSNADGTLTTITDLTYMQDMTPEIVRQTPVGETATLIDNRDTKPYTVAKLADGNVWMTQNLDHDIVTTQGFYTYANTDIGHGSTPNTNATWTADTATYTTSSWDYSVYTPESYDPGDLCWNGAIGDYTIATGTETCGSDKHYHIGNYYNWTVAVAMNDSSSYTTNLTSINQSICPAGWRLSTYSGNKSYANLVTTLGLTSGASGNIQNTPAYFVYGGHWHGESSDFGSDGYYWFSVNRDDDDAYVLYFGDDYVGAQEYFGRDYGVPIRCVARTDRSESSGTVSNISDLNYLQDFATLSSSEKTAVLNSMTPNQQYELDDNRDNKTYTIAKLADGNVWMTQNLDHDIETTEGFYTYANTDIGHGSTPNTSATWTADTATYATNDTTWNDTTTEPESYDPGNRCWDGEIGSYDLSTGTESCDIDRHYHIGNYYNWTAAVAMNDSSSYTTDLNDVDQSICPAGWRLPTYSGNKSYDNLVTALSLTSGASGNVQSAPAYFVYGGDWDGGSYGVGNVGDYWSSVVNDDGSAYDFTFGRNGYLGLQGDGDRDYGVSVRCVAR